MARSSSLFKAFRKKGLHVQADITVSYNSLSAFLLTSFALPHTHSQTHCRRNFSTFFTLLQGPTQLADGHDQLLVYTTRAFSFIKWTRGGPGVHILDSLSLAGDASFGLQITGFEGIFFPGAMQRKVPFCRYLSRQVCGEVKDCLWFHASPPF